MPKEPIKEKLSITHFSKMPLLKLSKKKQYENIYPTLMHSKRINSWSIAPPIEVRIFTDSLRSFSHYLVEYPYPSVWNEISYMKVFQFGSYHLWHLFAMPITKDHGKLCCKDNIQHHWAAQMIFWRHLFALLIWFAFTQTTIDLCSQLLYF